MRTVTVFLLLLLAAGPAAASGNHASAGASGLHFQVNTADIHLTVEPAHFQPWTTPRLVARLTDPASGNAVLDADLLARLVPVAPAGAMAAMAATTPPAPAANRRKTTGLDFGLLAPPPAATLDLTGFIPLAPGQRAGEFSALQPVAGPGTYALQLAVRGINGRPLATVLRAAATIDYQPPSRAPLYRRLLVMAAVVTTFAAILLLAWSRGRNRQTAGEPYNLLDIPLVARFFRSSWYQPLFQFPTLAVFAGIVVLGLAGPQAGDRNLATILTWTIWWAGVIFSFVLVGRIWCMMCPFGAVQDWLGGRRKPRRRFPRPLRNIWLSSALFLGLTWWDAYAGIVNNPKLTAWLLIGFLVVATLSALVYRGRTFCRYVCPIGGLIGLYSMFSPVELRARSREICRADRDKGCIRGTARSRPCPMFETPMTMDRNNYCNLCAQCARGCGRDNIVLRLRGFGRDLWTSGRPALDEAWLAMALVGLTTLVTAEMIAPWHGWVDRLIGLLPLAALGVVSHVAQEKAIFTILFVLCALVVPALLLYLTSRLVARNGAAWRPMTTREVFSRFAYMFIPVGLAMHLAHNTAHLLREGVEVVPVAQALVGGGASRVAPLVGMETLFWLQMTILVVLNGYALYSGYRMALKTLPERPLAAFGPMATLALFFTLVNVYVLSQPMSLRHHH